VTTKKLSKNESNQKVIDFVFILTIMIHMVEGSYRLQPIFPAE